MIGIRIDKKKCCGCSACEFICPTRAISMEVDEQGFKYPIVDSSLCIECGKCNDACDFNKNSDVSNEIPLIYAAKHKDSEVIMSSRSGGVFVAISDYILQNGGIIYGCILDEDMCVRHTRAVTNEERDKMCGSKYVQSDLKDVFRDIEDDLKNEKIVLFSGTSCQVAALKSIIKNEKLITVDILCHGVSSPTMFREYIKGIEKEGKCVNYIFRDKTRFGWRASRESWSIIDCNGNKRTETGYKFTHLYYELLSVRPGCFSCKYKSLSHVSDITLGDFWGIEKVLPDYNDDKGTSLVLINSELGHKIYSEIKNELNYELIEPCNVLMQRTLVSAYEMPKLYYCFWSDYLKYGFEKCYKIYWDKGLLQTFRRLWRKIISLHIYIK